jgi:KaiC/GvpD/RAD55 family RecA-like ATPase
MNQDARVPFGIPRLDSVLSGGLLPGSSTLVAGCLGSGKTMLGMHLLLNASARHQPGLYLSFAGDPGTMVVSRDGIGAQFREQVGKKSILLHANDNFNHRDGLARLKNICQVRKVRVAVLDGLHYVNMAHYAELTGLLSLLKGLGITVLLAYGLPQRATELDAPAEQMGFYCDTLLMLFRTNLRDTVNRQATVLKMRGSPFLPTQLSFTITADGITAARTTPVRAAVRRGRENVQVYFPFSFFGQKWAAYFRWAGELLQRKYPGIVCTVVNENTINLRQLLSARESNVVLALVPLDGLPGLARRGLLMQLDNVLPQTTRRDLLERAMAGGSWQNTLWAVPRFIDRQVILYNKKLLKKYGFAPPRIWNDLLRQSKTIVDREKDPDLVGCLVPFDASGLPFLFIEYLWSLGIGHL